MILYPKRFTSFCFHFSDLPSMLSGSQIGVIDPHEEYFTEGKNRRTGYSWKITDDRHIINNIPDQFSQEAATTVLYFAFHYDSDPLTFLRLSIPLKRCTHYLKDS